MADAKQFDIVSLWNSCVEHLSFQNISQSRYKHLTEKLVYIKIL